MSGLLSSSTPSMIDGFSIILYGNLLLSVLANAYGLFLLGAKCPHEISEYRWFLLHILLCTFFFDLNISLFFQPFAPLPALGICTNGLFRRFPRFILLDGFGPIFIFGVLAGMFLCSFYLAIGYRLTSLFELQYVLCSRRGITLIVIAHLSVVFSIVVSLLALLKFGKLWEKQSQLHHQMVEVRYKMDPNVSALIPPGSVCVFASFDIPAFRYALYELIIAQGISVLVGAALFGASLYSLHSRRYFMSAKTRSLHLQFILALGLQLVVPFTVVLLPGILIECNLIFGFPHLTVLNTFAAIVSTHSTLNVLLMVLFTKCYRIITLQYLRRFAQKLTPCWKWKWMMLTKKQKISVTNTTKLIRVKIPTNFKERLRRGIDQ